MSKSKQTMPEEVRRVHVAWETNAVKAGYGADAAYAYYDEKRHATYAEKVITSNGLFNWLHVNEDQQSPAWVVCCNHERAGFCLTYFPALGYWLYMPLWGDRCTLIKGGTEEAVANAQIAYTG